AEPVVQRRPVLVRPASSFAFVEPAGQATLVDRVSRSANPATSSERSRLIHNMQRELKRAGCYLGEIDGSWGPGSKRAIGRFMGRVNAALPSDEPDYIQLALLRSHPGEVCGVSSCSAGQTRSASGRCVVRPTVAMRRPAVSTDVATTSKKQIHYGRTALAAVPSPALPERKSISLAASHASSWSTEVVKERLAVPEPRLVRTQRSQPPRGRPEGMMALQGPRPASISARQRAPGEWALPKTGGQPAPSPDDVYGQDGLNAFEPDAQQAAPTQYAPKPKKTRTIRKAKPKKSKKRTASKKRKWRKRKPRNSIHNRERGLIQQAFGGNRF
ncbi:MAG: hypothetical protein AAFO75_11605, partial [Pseudomonadota bacterium]